MFEQIKHIYLIAAKDISQAFHSYSLIAIGIAFSLFCGIYTFYLYPFFIVGYASLGALFEVAPLLLILCLPALSMSAFVDEKKAGHLDMLWSMPIKDSALLLGKYIALLILLFAMIFSIAFYIPMVSHIGDLDIGLACSGLIGLCLLGSSILSIGLLSSLLSRSLMSAWSLTFALSISLYLINRTSNQLPSQIAYFVQKISLEWHYLQFCKGIIDLRDLLFFLLFDLFFLCCIYERLQARKLGYRIEA